MELALSPKGHCSWDRVVAPHEVRCVLLQRICVVRELRPNLRERLPASGTESSAKIHTSHKGLVRSRP